MARMLKVVSGGQTGVDRAALDAARALGLPCGGWCPRGRLAEDGPIAAIYPLVETPSTDYAQRTRWNVRDSDGTLVLTRGRVEGGTAFTVAVARRRRRPLLVVDLETEPDPADAARWLREAGIGVLNVAGPRESQRPGIGEEARAFLERLLRLTATRA
jgi:Circularly permutated YpsA SLOG family